MYEWVVNYSPHSKTYRAAKREHYNELFSNINSGNILSSSSFDTLEEVIMKTNGDPQKISKLIGEIDFQTDFNF